jgi:hypothetical protein
MVRAKNHDMKKNMPPAVSKKGKSLHSWVCITVVLVFVGVLLTCVPLLTGSAPAVAVGKVSASDDWTVMASGHRSRNMTCDRGADRDRVSGCSPVHCARVTMERFATADELRVLKTLVTQAFALTGGGDGPASIVDFSSGAVSKGTQFVDLYKFIAKERAAGNTKLPKIDESALTVYAAVVGRVAKAVSRHFGLEDLHFTSPTFFSRLRAGAAKNAHDEYWHRYYSLGVCVLDGKFVSQRAQYQICITAPTNVKMCVCVCLFVFVFFQPM